MKYGMMSWILLGAECLLRFNFVQPTDKHKEDLERRVGMLESKEQRDAKKSELKNLKPKQVEVSLARLEDKEHLNPEEEKELEQLQAKDRRIAELNQELGDTSLSEPRRQAM